MQCTRTSNCRTSITKMQEVSAHLENCLNQSAHLEISWWLFWSPVLGRSITVIFWIFESWIWVNIHPQIQTAEQLHSHRSQWPGSTWAAWDSCEDSTWQGRGAAVLGQVTETTLHVQRQSQCFLKAGLITHSWQTQLEQSISQNLMSCHLLAVSMSKISSQNGRYLM